MYQATQMLDKITLEVALDSLITKSRKMLQISLENQYLIYLEEVEQYYPDMEPVDFEEWVRITIFHERPSDIEGTLVVEEPDWLQRELESLEIPTWRDVPTGDLALDSEGESQETTELQEERVKIAYEAPWLPEQSLFTIETEIETTEEFTDISEAEDDWPCEMDFTEEINLNDLIY